MLKKLGYGMNGSCAPPASGPSYLDGVVASACCDLDATLAASYPGSGQTLANVIAAPADGAAQTGYDFHLGETSSAAGDDPTFSGTPGDAAAFFSVDGGDNFRIKNFASAPTLIKLQRTDNNNKWWVACAYSRAGAGSYGLWGSSWISTDLGAYYYSRLSDGVLYQGSGSVLEQATLADGDGGNGVNRLTLISVDMTATTNNIRLWNNTRTKAVYSKAYGAVTVDSDEIFRIFAVSNGGAAVGRMVNNSRFYHFSCGNAFIDDAEAALIFDHLNARHGRVYA